MSCSPMGKFWFVWKVLEGNFVCQNLLSTEMSKLVKFLQLGMKRLEKVCQLDHSPSKQLSSLDQVSKLDFGFSLGDLNTEQACESKIDVIALLSFGSQSLDSQDSPESPESPESTESTALPQESPDSPAYQNHHKSWISWITCLNFAQPNRAFNVEFAENLLRSGLKSWKLAFIQLDTFQHEILKVYPRKWRSEAAYNSFAGSFLSELYLKSFQWKLACAQLDVSQGLSQGLSQDMEIYGCV